MNAAVLIIATIVAFLIYIVGGRLYRFYLFSRQFNKIPGPKFAIPFLGIVYYFFTVPKEDQLEWSENVANQYKDRCFAMWAGPMASVQIQHPEHVEVILRSNDQIKKSIAYDFFKPWLGNGLLLSTGSHWWHNRKMINPTFNFSILEEFSKVMFEKAAIFNKCIEREIKIHGDRPFDIFGMSARCALDIIFETAMGVNFHIQENTDNEYIRAVHTLTRGWFERLFQPWLIPDWIFYRTSSGKAFAAAIKVAQDLCTRIIDKRRQERISAVTVSDESKENAIMGNRKKTFFLDLLLEANEKEDNPLTVEEMRDQINTFMFGGHDTTGSLLGWALFCLGTELDVQKKVHEELDEIVGDSDDRAILQHLPNLKYLDRVIKEVLRLYPSVTMYSREVTKDVQLGDHAVPKNAIVIIQVYNLHRDASVWPDPLRFDPDRFLPENIKNRHPYAYVPFSAGPRNCIGQKYAMLESKIILATILKKFNVKSIDNHSTIKKFSTIILRPVDGIYVNMTKRSPEVKSFKG